MRYSIRPDGGTEWAQAPTLLEAGRRYYEARGIGLVKVHVLDTMAANEEERDVTALAVAEVKVRS